MYVSCFVTGFGIIGTFTVLFCITWWSIDKLQKVYFKWRNPWAELENCLKQR